MKVITQLIEAYSQYMNLPVLLVNETGEIDFKGNAEKISHMDEMDRHFMSEFKEISSHIRMPQILSVPLTHTVEVSYIITPRFTVMATTYFLVVGPFNEEATTVLQYDSFASNELMSKVQNLYEIILKKEHSTTENLLSEKLLALLQTLGNYDCTIANYDVYIENLLQEFIKLDDFDFIAYAKKNEDESFTVVQSFSQQLPSLKTQRFYMGEGLIGRATILGQPFYWDKNASAQRSEFFHQQGITVDCLFGSPVESGGVVSAIIFGGNNKGKAIEQKIIHLINCVTLFISQRQKVTEQLSNSYYTQSIFGNWIDLMDIAQQTKNYKHICYKVLDFCQTLNGGKFSCFTSYDTSFFYRGMMNANILTKHHQAVEKLKVNAAQQAQCWIDLNCIHFELYFSTIEKGLFTVEFQPDVKLHQIKDILNAIPKLIRPEHPTQISLQNNTIFDTLQSSMKELNAYQYEMTNLALTLADKFIIDFNIAEQYQQPMRNLCKVLPYRFAYLKEQLPESTERQILLEIEKLLTFSQKALENFSFASKVLTFIYRMILERQKNEQFLFLESSLKDNFLNTYKEALHLIEIDDGKVDADKKHIEEMADLKGIIDTLALTVREKEILYLILEGLNNPEVGEYLNISVHTVKNHVTNIFKKLNVSDRIQAMAKVYRIKYDDGNL